ncbi:hypothetical protein GCM10028795_19560 [Lysobacter olei]
MTQAGGHLATRKPWAPKPVSLNENAPRVASQKLREHQAMQRIGQGEGIAVAAEALPSNPFPLCHVEHAVGLRKPRRPLTQLDQTDEDAKG